MKLPFNAIFLGRFIHVLVKMLIGVFCLWHGTAIFSYSLYHVEDIPVLQWVSDQRHYFKPYVLTTSQWQRWNLFSPDPLRRVIEIDIEQKINGKWVRIHTINEHHVSWWQRAPELKTMRRMEGDDNLPLRERYLHDFCRMHNIPKGTVMRMKKRWHVIPKHEEVHSKDWWQAWSPDWNSNVDFEITCTPL